MNEVWKPGQVVLGAPREPRTPAFSNIVFKTDDLLTHIIESTRSAFEMCKRYPIQPRQTKDSV